VEAVVGVDGPLPLVWTGDVVLVDGPLPLVWTVSTDGPLTGMTTGVGVGSTVMPPLVAGPEARGTG
jgi:hypothetical protein